MKLKQATIALVILVMGQSALSAGMDPGLQSTLSTALSPVSTAESSSGGVVWENDILLVKQDAILALETGVVSDALASVLEKMQTVDSAFLGMSDEQLIQIIISK